MLVIPDAYASALVHVQRTFPGAVIAGGALRDLENERPVKDIDIFIPDIVIPEPEPVDGPFGTLTCVPDFNWLRTKIIESLPEGGELVGVMGSYEGWATEEVIGVFDIKTPDLDYQVICLTSGPETILPRMDFGICRISWDGSEVHRTDEYNADRLNECLTLHRCDDRTQYDRSITRYTRLAKKYQGWPLRIAPHLQDAAHIPS